MFAHFFLAAVTEINQLKSPLTGDRKEKYEYRILAFSLRAMISRLSLTSAESEGALVEFSESFEDFYKQTMSVASDDSLVSEWPKFRNNLLKLIGYSILLRHLKITDLNQLKDSTIPDKLSISEYAGDLKIAVDGFLGFIDNLVEDERSDLEVEVLKAFQPKELSEKKKLIIRKVKFLLQHCDDDFKTFCKDCDNLVRGIESKVSIFYFAISYFEVHSNVNSFS